MKSGLRSRRRRRRLVTNERRLGEMRQSIKGVKSGGIEEEEEMMRGMQSRSARHRERRPRACRGPAHPSLDVGQRGRRQSPDGVLEELDVTGRYFHEDVAGTVVALQEGAQGRLEQIGEERRSFVGDRRRQRRRDQEGRRQLI